MSNLLSELDAVDRLCEASREAGGKFNIEGTEQFVDYSLKLLALYRDHHAEIAAAVRDAARYRWLRDHQFSFTHDQHERGIASTRWGEWIDVDDAETLDLCIDTVMRDGSDHDRKVDAMSAREGE